MLPSPYLQASPYIYKLYIFLIGYKQVIEYLIETDPTVFVASFIEKLGQSEVLNLLLSIVWLLSPSPSKASSQATGKSITAM